MLIRKRFTGFPRCSTTKVRNILFGLLGNSMTYCAPSIYKENKETFYYPPYTCTHYKVGPGGKTTASCSRLIHPSTRQPFLHSMRKTPQLQFKYSQNKVTMERNLIPKFKLQKG